MGILSFPSRRRPAARFDEEALAHMDALYRAALRMMRDPDAAQDLVQDTYLKAFRGAHRFERGTNLRAWLFTILMNTARNRRRDAARDRVVVDSEAVDAAPLASPDATPEDRLLHGVLDEELDRALHSLPESFREAVWLRDVEEFSYAEIAGILEIPVGTVMSRIARGRRLLFERLVAAKAADPAVAGPPR